jgi:hypothetical protein
MSPRYAEGYLKGVHDHDAARLLEALVRLTRTADLLRYPTDVRAAAALYWHGFTGRKKKAAWQQQLRGIGVLLQVFPESREFDALKAELQLAIEEFAAVSGLFAPAHLAEAGDYLFFELTRGETFVIAAEAAELLLQFQQSLRERTATEQFEASVALLAEQPAAQFQLVRQWLQSFLQQLPASALAAFRDECTVLLLTNSFDAARVVRTPLLETLTDLEGAHPRIQERRYQLNFPEFRRRLHHYARTVVPLFEAFGTLKKELVARFAEELRLAEFRPRVLASFVRNKLIDEVYLPLIGANLAKQIGTAGANKRTDLMGLLLLVSPTGWA